MLFGTIGIGMAASAAAVFNHVLDARIDIHMLRTRGRPLPEGRVSETNALTFASATCVLSMIILWFLVNPLTAVLTFGSLIGYAVIYTVFLKRATPQNIVIGGILAAGILLLFLRSWRPTLVISLAIPVSVIGSFVAMAALGLGVDLRSVTAAGPRVVTVVTLSLLLLGLAALAVLRLTGLA